MDLKDFTRNLERRRESFGVAYEIRPPASKAEIDEAEHRLGQPLPEQVRLFYLTCNGLTVSEPALEIIRVDRLEIRSDGLLPFAIADDKNEIAFDTTARNQTGQWDIVNAASRETITLTMASFWSNKIWKWMDRRLKFWDGEVFEPI